MKRVLLLAAGYIVVIVLTMFAISPGFQAAHAQTGINIATVAKTCTPAQTPYLIMWAGIVNGNVPGIVCVGLPAGWTYSNGVLTITQTTGPAPQWTAETISLASLPVGSTSISYTPLHTPLTGIVQWWYNASNTWLTAAGVIAYTSTTAPMVFTLPGTWTSLDTIVINYQYTP